MSILGTTSIWPPGRRRTPRCWKSVPSGRKLLSLFDFESPNPETENREKICTHRHWNFGEMCFAQFSPCKSIFDHFWSFLLGGGGLSGCIFCFAPAGRPKCQDFSFWAETHYTTRAHAGARAWLHFPRGRSGHCVCDPVKPRGRRARVCAHARSYKCAKGPATKKGVRHVRQISAQSGWLTLTPRQRRLSPCDGPTRKLPSCARLPRT